MFCVSEIVEPHGGVPLTSDVRLERKWGLGSGAFSCRSKCEVEHAR